MKSINKTIAVLPFVNMSTSEENEYFSDGITEEIINALAKINSLKVTSRTSSFFFKNQNIPIQQIAEKLKVSTILEGSVRISGNILRITAQLIQAKEDFHFWSETWDRKMDNIFEIQDEISLIIADRLREHFGHFEIQDHLVEKQTESLDAYQYSLKAKYHANKWNPEDVKTAILLYNKALVLDPNHTESILGLADSYSFLGTTGFMSFEEAWGNTIQYTNQALAITDKLPGVHYQLSNQAFFIGCDFKKSLIEMKRAIEIKPNYAEAQQFISFLYVVSGNIEKAKIHLDIAVGINPLSEETKFFIAYFHYMIGDYNKSLTLLNNCLEVNNKNIPAYSVKSICLLMLGRYDEVLTFFDVMPKEVVIEGEKTGAIALAYAFKKDKVNTEKYVALLKEQAKDSNGFTADSYWYLVNAVMGNFDVAFDWVDSAIKNKSTLLMLRYADPLAKSLQKDVRYTQFHKMIFPKVVDEKPQKIKKALLDAENIQLYSSRLLSYIKDKKPYLDSNLSLRLLAEKIEIHPNQLSWLLNENLGKNFNEFINYYRVEAFKKIAKDPKNAHITLIGLAYDSGFNSKTVFNTYFKKETGLTPNQFLKS